MIARNPALILVVVITIAGTIGIAYAYSATYQDSFNGDSIDKDFLLQFSDDGSWSGRTWNNSMRIDASQCTHTDAYLSVAVSGLSSIPDESIIKISLNGQEGAAKIYGGNATVSGFFCKLNGGTVTLSVSAILPDGYEWQNGAQMSVTVTAVDS